MKKQSDIEELVPDGTHCSAATDAKLHENGWEIIGCDGKAAYGPGWPTRPNTIDAIAAERAARPRATNTGTRAGRLAPTDIDLIPPHHVAAMKTLADKVLGHTALDRVGAKGLTDYRRNETPIGKITIWGLHKTLTHVDKGKTVPLPGKVELLGTGQQSVIYGIHPDTGRPYEWPNADLMAEPLQTAVSDLPEVTPAMLHEFAGQAKTLMEELGYRDVTINGIQDEERKATRSSTSGKRLSWAGLRARLSYIHPRFDGARPADYPAPSGMRVANPLPYDGGAWLSLALCLRDGNVPLLDAVDHNWLDLIEEWSSGALWFERTGERLDLRNRFPQQGIAQRLQGEARNAGNITGVASIISYAADGACPLPPDDEPRVSTLTIEALANLNADDAAAPEGGSEDHCISTSEDELAVQYVDTRHRNVKFIPELGEWAMLQDRRWHKKTREEIWEDMLPFARAQAAKAPSIPAARKLTSRGHLSNSEALMRGKKRAIVKLEHWDSDPMLLNTPDGAYQLPSGEPYVSEQPPYCLKATAVAPVPKGGDLRDACPLWHKFMGEITAGDIEYQKFFQRFIGYCLTGQTVEHAMVVAQGGGGNGKGVLFGTLNRVFGDYAQIAPLGMFEASPHERHTTEMARLHGARFVTAQETKKEARWDEVKIKAITGGDKITARWLFQKPFEFTPQCKLAIAGQHLPTLSRVDNAIKRRLLILPFTVTFSNPDLDLPEKLWRERAGILRWAMDGTAEWTKRGLAPPAVVQEATRQYFSEQDHLGSWISARCIVAPGGWAAGKDLHADYCIHTQRSGAIVDGEKTFGQNLEARGFARKNNKANTTRGFAGIALRPAQEYCAESLPDLEEGEF